MYRLTCWIQKGLHCRPNDWWVSCNSQSNSMPFEVTRIRWYPLRSRLWFGTRKLLWWFAWQGERYLSRRRLEGCTHQWKDIGTGKKVISLEMKSTQRMVCLHKSMMNAKLSQQSALGAVYIVRTQPRGVSHAFPSTQGASRSRSCTRVQNSGPWT